jgi:DNA-binding LacI/PurR family transcriptional regulator
MARKYCTVKDIARAANVSLSTVSYALRNHPRIPASTCARIQAIAENLGYRRNPHISALMAVIGQGRKIRTVENLALIWPHGLRQHTKTTEFCVEIVSAVTARARALGFRLEQFWMEEDNLSGARLSTILLTRNIRGLIFAPALHGFSLEPGLTWDRFVTVVLGHAQWKPEMHRCMSNHYNAVRVCLDQLAAMGAKKPAAIFSSEINHRTDFAQEAAFLTHHPQPAKARKLIFFEDGRSMDKIFEWLQATKADSVIFGTNRIYDSCMEFDKTTLGRLQLVTLNWESSHPMLPGIRFRHDLIAESAVDLLVSQLHINDAGVPERARRLSLRGDWMPAAPRSR